MNTAKEQVRQLLDQLPEDATPGEIQSKLNDALYTLYVQNRIEQGLKDSRSGLVIPHSQVKERFLNGKRKLDVGGDPSNQPWEGH